MLDRLVSTLSALESIPFLLGNKIDLDKAALTQLWLLLKWGPLSTCIQPVGSGSSQMSQHEHHCCYGHIG